MDYSNVSHTIQVVLSPEQVLEFNALGPGGRQVHYATGLVYDCDQSKVQVEQLKNVIKHDYSEVYVEQTITRQLSRGRTHTETGGVLTPVLKITVTGDVVKTLDKAGRLKEEGENRHGKLWTLLPKKAEAPAAVKTESVDDLKAKIAELEKALAEKSAKPEKKKKQDDTTPPTEAEGAE